MLIRFDKDKTVNFMNYGYSGLNGEEKIMLEKGDEKDRYCIQLYDHVVRSGDLAGKRVLEVGSGRGGGAYYISRYYKPSQYTGMDISSSVIEFCNRFYKFPGLSFVQGRAEKIPFDSEAYDAVVNVESARCYSSIKEFFSEVHRVLNPGGHFFFADMVGKDEISDIRERLSESGFTVKSENNITRNVAKGLDLDNLRREELISKRIPGFLRKWFSNFAGTRGTKRYESFSNGKFEYWSFVLSKAAVANN